MAQVCPRGLASARRLLDKAQVVTAGFDDVPTMLGLLQARALGGLLVGDLDAVRSASSEGIRGWRPDRGDTTFCTPHAPTATALLSHPQALLLPRPLARAFSLHSGNPTELV
jgi:hypothetical protein